MYICIPSEYSEGKLFGSWNDWKEPIDLKYYDFKIEPYLFFIIETTEKSLSYKIKIDEEFILIEDYTTIEENGFTNNYCVMTNDNFCLNGYVKIKNIDNRLTIFKEDKLFFEGSSKLGFPHGYGKEYCYDETLYFEGNYKFGIRNGKGINFYENGIRLYEGEWLNGLRNGQGTSYYENGNKPYEGDLQNNLPNGIVIFDENGIRLYEGELYEGEWLNDKYHGQGTSYYENGNIQYEGEWINDLPHGKGSSYESNGIKQYEGEWLNGKFIK